MTKCHKGTVTVAGGLCDGTKVDIQMCGSPDMTDAMKEEGLTQMGKGAGETLTMDMCTSMKTSMDTGCAGVGGTAKDICADPGDLCKMQIQSMLAMGGTCSSDDDCKAGSGTGAGDGTGGGTGGGTGAGDGTGGGTGGGTGAKKPCCKSVSAQLKVMCTDTNSVQMTSYETAQKTAGLCADTDCIDTGAGASLRATLLVPALAAVMALAAAF
eukprot:Tamp_23970.p1 GENE.Tamp_23970~~Tamp_23970.p1  ORF type:complete len:247 (+),score=59.47 Tamp_23970:106-741(+)